MKQFKTTYSRFTNLCFIAIILPPFAHATIPELDCLILPEKTVTVSASVIGVVDEVLVTRGDFVKKGQTVAFIERTMEKAFLAIAKSQAESSAELNSSKAQLEYEEKRLDRIRVLSKKGSSSEQQLEEVEIAWKISQARYDQSVENNALAKLELAQAQAAMEHKKIISPINGLVVEKILNVGEYADPPQVMKIAQLDPLRVDIIASSSLLGKIKLGQEATITPLETSTAPIKATVVLIDKIIDAASGTFRIKLRIENPDYHLPAGLKCSAKF